MYVNIVQNMGVSITSEMKMLTREKSIWLRMCWKQKIYLFIFSQKGEKEIWLHTLLRLLWDRIMAVYSTRMTGDNSTQTHICTQTQCTVHVPIPLYNGLSPHVRFG